MIKPWQIPLCEILAKRLCGGSSLQEAIAVRAEVLPVPVAKNSLQQWLGLFGGFLEFGLQACDLLLRFVSLNSTFVCDALGQGLDRLGMFALLHCRVVDQLQLGRRCLGQSFLLRVCDLLPQRFSIRWLCLR